MSDSISLHPVHLAGITTAASSKTSAPAGSTRLQSDGLRPGMQVSIQPGRLVAPNVLEVRLQASTSGQEWTGTMRAQLTDQVPDRLAQQLTSTSASAMMGSRATTPLLAEIVSVSPRLALRLIGPIDGVFLGSQAPTPGSRDWVGLQLRQHLPGSRPLTSTLSDLFSRLDSIAGSSRLESLGNLESGAAIRQGVEALIERLATSEDLTHVDKLSAAVRHSGIWLESMVAQTASNPMLSAHLIDDLKGRLLYLAQRLRSHQDPSSSRALAERVDRSLSPQPDADTLTSPRRESGGLAGQLFKQVDGMIKQIVTNQLQSLDQTRDPHWVLELPFKTATGLIALEADIGREPKSRDDEEDAWCMRLNLDLPHLGPLTIRLSLRSERLSASLQAGTDCGAETLRQNLERLREQLEARDIEIASLCAGKRAREPAPPPFEEPLLSEQA